MWLLLCWVGIVGLIHAWSILNASTKNLRSFSFFVNVLFLVLGVFLLRKKLADELMRQYLAKKHPVPMCLCWKKIA